MLPNCHPKDLGFPFIRGPVRFAVGPPDGLTSNSWKFWTTANGDVYLACRDNFKEVKVSLHASGRWRMGFTTEAIVKDPNLVAPEANRAWDVWDAPTPVLPNTVRAFQVVFPPAELAVRPGQRGGRAWRKVIFVESAPPGKMTVFSVLITTGNPQLTHGSEPRFIWASLDIGNGRYAQLAVHGEPEDGLPQLIDDSVTALRRQAEANGVKVPDEAYAYLFGRRPDGTRYIVGARMCRARRSSDVLPDNERA